MMASLNSFAANLVAQINPTKDSNTTPSNPPVKQVQVPVTEATSRQDSSINDCQASKDDHNASLHDDEGASSSNYTASGSATYFPPQFDKEENSIPTGRNSDVTYKEPVLL